MFEEKQRDLLLSVCAERRSFDMENAALMKPPAPRSKPRARLTKRPREAHRIQFEFSPDAYERLNTLREVADASSYAQLVRDALRVYEWVLEQERQGYSIGLVKGDKLVKEIKFVL